MGGAPSACRALSEMETGAVLLANMLEAWLDDEANVRTSGEAVDELKKVYESKGITPDKDVICYCRIGERSSHTWFVLKYLLGYPQVRNYDGSWTEWGNMIGNPIEK